jgi:flagellar biosynthesis protein FlhF
LIIETRSVLEQYGGGIEILASSESQQNGLTLKYSNRPGSWPAESATTPARSEETSPPPTIANAAIQEELAALRSILSWLAPGLNHKNRILKSLVGQGLSPEIMTRLSEAIEDGEGADEREKTYQALNRLIATGGHIPDAVDRLALVGPTGVGKTSSIIKLTVYETQRLQRRIGWLNLDHRRIASGDPLALYATILGARYETATDAKQAKRAWKRLADCDLILVDTPGVTPRDEKGYRDLGRLLHALPGLRRSLLLSASTNGADMIAWVRQYQCLGFDSLFFTKLDECRHFGSLLNTALGAGYPLSYISLGQNMAGDLEAAKAEVLTSLLLSGSDNYETL